MLRRVTIRNASWSTTFKGQKMKKADGINAREANPTGGMSRDATMVIGAGETMGKEEVRTETTPDGKRELDYGKESLDKKPKKKLQERWESIKKNLDSS